LAIPILLGHHLRVSQDGVQGIRVRFTSPFWSAKRTAGDAQRQRWRRNSRTSLVRQSRKGRANKAVRPSALDVVAAAQFCCDFATERSPPRPDSSRGDATFLPTPWRHVSSAPQFTNRRARRTISLSSASSVSGVAPCSTLRPITRRVSMSSLIQAATASGRAGGQPRTPAAGSLPLDRIKQGRQPDGRLHELRLRRRHMVRNVC
jgi:hypothetical protein